MRRTALLLALLSPSLLVGIPGGGGGQAMAAAEPQRTAIVVGARRAPPGRAPLRYAHDDAGRVSEVLTGGGVTSLAEADLVRSGFGPGGTKDAGAGTGVGVDGFAQAEEALWSEQQASLSVALGVRHAPVIDPGLRLASAEGDAAFMLRASFRIARRLWLAAPLALVMDSQGPGAADWFFWGGAPVVGGADEAAVGFTVRGFVGAGADLRWRLGQTRALNASVAELGAFAGGRRRPRALDRRPGRRRSRWGSPRRCPHR